jgi:uncharacterized protein (TIGR01244 family)
MSTRADPRAHEPPEGDPLTEFRAVTDTFSVSPQIALADIARAAAEGFSLIINNRPDGEAPGQPTSEAMAAEARARGLAYAYIPVVGGPTPDQVAAVQAAVEAAPGKVLAYCRSGTRSIVTWSLGQKAAGSITPDDLIARGAAAGYDLSGLFGR